MGWKKRRRRKDGGGGGGGREERGVSGQPGSSRATRRKPRAATLLPRPPSSPPPRLAHTTLPHTFPSPPLIHPPSPSPVLPPSPPLSHGRPSPCPIQTSAPRFSLYLRFLLAARAAPRGGCWCRAGGRVGGHNHPHLPPLRRDVRLSRTHHSTASDDDISVAALRCAVLAVRAASGRFTTAPYKIRSGDSTSCLRGRSSLFFDSAESLSSRPKTHALFYPRFLCSERNFSPRYMYTWV